jgi:hypothetical protein
LPLTSFVYPDFTQELVKIGGRLFTNTASTTPAVQKFRPSVSQMTATRRQAILSSELHAACRRRDADHRELGDAFHPKRVHVRVVPFDEGHVHDARPLRLVPKSQEVLRRRASSSGFP